MNEQRYNDLMKFDTMELTLEEVEQKWHFCLEWDGLLVGPDMNEFKVCRCFEFQGHAPEEGG